MTESPEAPAPLASHEGEKDPIISAPNERSAQARLTILGAFLALFCTVGFVNAFGLFQDYYHHHQLNHHKSEFDISWLGSFATFVLFLCAAPAGLLVDKTGPMVPLCGGSIGTILAIFMTSLCTEYYQLFLAQVSRHFTKNRGLAMGIAIAGSSTGGIIWPIMLDQLLNSDGVSFGWSMRIVGFTMLPLLITASITVRSPSKAPQNSGSNAEISQGPQGHKIDVSIAKDATFLTLCAGLAIAFLGLFSPLFFVTSYATNLGLSTSISFYLVSVVNGASLFGRVLSGFLADRYGHFNLLSLALLLSGIMALCWTAAKNVAGLVVWSLAYGFTSGAIMSLQSSSAAQLSTPATHGTALGLVMGSAAVT